MKKPNKLPSKEDILQVYSYDRSNGTLTHKNRNKPVGSNIKSNDAWYLTVGLKVNEKYSVFGVHRVIFFLETGEEPIEVDHIDGNKLNNHISNLRAATRQQNKFNTKSRCRTSSYKGVSQSGSFWSSFIKANGKKCIKGQNLMI